MTGEPSGARRGGQDLGKEVGGVGGISFYCVEAGSCDLVGIRMNLS